MKIFDALHLDGGWVAPHGRGTIDADHAATGEAIRWIPEGDERCGTLLLMCTTASSSTLATRVREVRPDRIADFRGTYDAHLASQDIQ